MSVTAINNAEWIIHLVIRKRRDRQVIYKNSFGWLWPTLTSAQRLHWAECFRYYEAFLPNPIMDDCEWLDCEWSSSRSKLIRISLSLSSSIWCGQLWRSAGSSAVVHQTVYQLHCWCFSIFSEYMHTIFVHFESQTDKLREKNAMYKHNWQDVERVGFFFYFFFFFL